MQCDAVAVALRDVAVEAVLRDVQLPADEPLGVRQLPLEDGLPVLAPREQLARLALPEPEPVGVGLFVERAVGHQGLGREAGRRREGPGLGPHDLDRSTGVGR